MQRSVQPLCPFTAMKKFGGPDARKADSSSSETASVNTLAFVGTNPTEARITSGLPLSGSKPEELSHLVRDSDEASTSHAIDYPHVENSGVAPANSTSHFMLPTVALTAERALLLRTPTVYSTSTTCSVAGPRTIGMVTKRPE
jgi:hypothetical protein